MEGSVCEQTFSLIKFRKIRSSLSDDIEPDLSALVRAQNRLNFFPLNKKKN